MLELTTAAKERLHKSLCSANETREQGKCFRVVPKDDRHLTLRLARPMAGDSVFTHDGDNVLALPKALQPFFEDKSLDIDEEGQLQLS